jgi:hypothetical protein
MAETVRLREFILGLEPYIVLTVQQGETTDVHFAIEAGGGMTEDDVAMVLILAGEQFRVKPTRFAELLQSIVDADTDYDQRYGLVLEAVALAYKLGIPAGFGIDRDSGAEMDGYRVVAYIEVPGVGQVSWHMPEHGQPWDGHSTAVKFDRIAAYASEFGPGESVNRG